MSGIPKNNIMEKYLDVSTYWLFTVITYKSVEVFHSIKVLHYNGSKTESHKQ